MDVDELKMYEDYFVRLIKDGKMTKIISDCPSEKRSYLENVIIDAVIEAIGLMDVVSLTRQFHKETLRQETQWYIN